MELFRNVPGRRGFGRDVPVSTPARGCVERVVVGRPVFTTVGRVGRGVTTGCRCVIIVSGRERGYVPVEHWVFGPTVPGQQGVAVPSSVDRRREQGPLP